MTTPPNPVRSYSCVLDANFQSPQPQAHADYLLNTSSRCTKVCSLSHGGVTVRLNLYFHYVYNPLLAPMKPSGFTSPTP